MQYYKNSKDMIIKIYSKRILISPKKYLVIFLDNQLIVTTIDICRKEFLKINPQYFFSIYLWLIPHLRSDVLIWIFLKYDLKHDILEIL